MLCVRCVSQAHFRHALAVMRAFLRAVAPAPQAVTVKGGDFMRSIAFPKSL